MSRTDKDMAYELRLEDATACRNSGTAGAVVVWRNRWFRLEPRVYLRVRAPFLKDNRNSYGSKYVRESKTLGRRNERRTQKHWLSEHFSSRTFDEPEADFEPGTKARRLAEWWW